MEVKGILFAKESAEICHQKGKGTVIGEKCAIELVRNVCWFTTSVLKYLNKYEMDCHGIFYTLLLFACSLIVLKQQSGYAYLCFNTHPTATHCHTNAQNLEEKQRKHQHM